MSAGFQRIIGFMTEKRPGSGEDAAPITHSLEKFNTDVVGVFDGMGGAGATIVNEENGIDKCTMARLASRVARDEVEKQIFQLSKEDLTELKTSLESSIVNRLKTLAAREGGKGPETGIRGTILKPYPTTVALAFIQTSKHEHETRRVKTYWAGDSRIYCLDPSRQIPLQVLTRDHTEPGGGGDAALQRYASAAGLNLDSKDFELPPEAAVIAMTDGCYGYMSNFQLMYLLVSQMVRSRDENDWKERIQERISRVAGDDTSFSISFGSGGFESLKREMEPRLSQMEPLAHIVESKPPNPLIVPHQVSAYFDVLDASDRLADSDPTTGVLPSPETSVAEPVERPEPAASLRPTSLISEV